MTQLLDALSYFFGLAALISLYFSFWCSAMEQAGHE